MSLSSPDAPQHPHPRSPEPPATDPYDAPARRIWWYEAVSSEQDQLHRVLIASPWERYRLDRHAAEVDDDPHA